MTLLQATGILYGQARFAGGTEVVEIVSMTSKNAKVRRVYKDRPFGSPIIRHIKKHGVKVHGVNVIRHDYMQK